MIAGQLCKSQVINDVATGGRNSPLDLGILPRNPPEQRLIRRRPLALQHARVGRDLAPLADGDEILELRIRARDILDLGLQSLHPLVPVRRHAAAARGDNEHLEALWGVVERVRRHNGRSEGRVGLLVGHRIKGAGQVGKGQGGEGGEGAEDLDGADNVEGVEVGREEDAVVAGKGGGRFVVVGARVGGNDVGFGGGDEARGSEQESRDEAGGGEMRQHGGAVKKLGIIWN